MNINQKLLTSWNGEATRREYIVLGILLFAIKYNLDRLVAFLFNRDWNIINYFVQADKLTIQELSGTDEKFYLALLILSLPFIWFGTVLCMKRLRNAKLPSWIVLFFFIPFVNLLLFIILSTIPESRRESPTRETFLSRFIPSSKYGSAMFAVGVVLVIGLGLTGLMVKYWKDYGWSLFVGIPFFLGFGSVLLYGYHNRVSFGEAIRVSFISVLFFNLIIFILAFEGIICIAMALPIIVPIGLIGATIAYAILDKHNVPNLNIFILPVLILPLTGYLEYQDQNRNPIYSVSTEITINASKYEVWNQLVAFSEIEEPTEFLFKTGIAYPVHAEIDGIGEGAIRKCNFTTGSFIETDYYLE